MTNLLEKWIHSIQEKTWFIKLRAKWDELDPQSRMYIQGTSLITLAIAVFWVTIGSWWKVHAIRREIAKKNEIIQMLQSGSDEIKTLRAKISPGRALGEDRSAWLGYLESISTSMGLDKASVVISSETQGKTGDFFKESIFEVSLNKINVKQLTRFCFQIENGTRPIQIKKLSVDTKTDLSGYLDAKLTISAYSAKKST